MPPTVPTQVPMPYQQALRWLLNNEDTLWLRPTERGFVPSRSVVLLAAIYARDISTVIEDLLIALGDVYDATRSDDDDNLHIDEL